MPTIDTPFMMELRPGEELKLARQPVAEEPDASAPAGSVNAFAKNDFQAWVSSVAFAEEEDTAGESAGTAKTSGGGHKHRVVRVSLLAHLTSQAAALHDRKRDRDGAATSSPSTSMKTVTLASWNFSASAASGAEPATASSTSATHIGGSVVFRAPLTFTSTGTIQSLSVVAEDMATTTGSSGSSGSVKRYQGGRRFAVRLQGLQQTKLTEQQVVLLAKQ